MIAEASGWPAHLSLEATVIDLPAYFVASEPSVTEWLGDVHVKLDPNPLPDMNAATVCALDAPPEAVIDRVRAWYAARGRDRFVWSIPDRVGLEGLAEPLLATGAVADPAAPVLTAMLLEHEPPAVESAVEIRLERTYEEFVARWELILASFDFAEADRARVRARYAEDFEAVQRQTSRTMFLAYDGTRLVGFGAVLDTTLPIVELSGAAVVPEARGRGIYRALVRARWDDAVGRGKPRLGIHASPDARARLLPLGFRELGTIRCYLDASRPGIDLPG